MEKILLVIDMQECFISNAPHTMKGLEPKIAAKVKKSTMPVWLVEYADKHSKPETLVSIRRAKRANPLAGKSHIIRKFSDDGSNEVNKKCKGKKKHFYICGVNTNYCVRATAIGLASWGHKITLLKALCRTSSAGDQMSYANQLVQELKK